MWMSMFVMCSCSPGEAPLLYDISEKSKESQSYRRQWCILPGGLVAKELGSHLWLPIINTFMRQAHGPRQEPKQQLALCTLNAVGMRPSAGSLLMSLLALRS